jgi:hypothetical protein
MWQRRSWGALLILAAVLHSGCAQMQSMGGTDVLTGLVTKLSPGADTYMKTARDLGAVTGPVGDRAGLTDAFSRLGMGSDMVPKFTQILSDFVGKAGGQPASNLLMQAVK